jgi:hypothetical protein
MKGGWPGVDAEQKLVLQTPSGSMFAMLGIASPLKEESRTRTGAGSCPARPARQEPDPQCTSRLTLQVWLALDCPSSARPLYASLPVGLCHGGR